MLKNKIYRLGLLAGCFCITTMLSAGVDKFGDDVINSEILDLLDIAADIEKEAISDQNYTPWKKLQEGCKASKVPVQELLKKIPDESIPALIDYYTSSFDLIVGVVALSAYVHDFGVMTSFFSNGIIKAWSDIDKIDAKLPLSVKCALKELDTYINESKIIGDQATGYSIHDFALFAGQAVRRCLNGSGYFELSSLLEYKLFNQLDMPTKDEVLKQAKISSVAAFWARLKKCSDVQGLTICDKAFATTLFQDARLSVCSHLSDEQYATVLRLMNMPDRFNNRLKEIRRYAKNSDNHDDIEKNIKGVQEVIDEAKDRFTSLQVDTKIGDITDEALLNVMTNFFNTGHLLILHLSTILDVLKERGLEIVLNNTKQGITEKNIEEALEKISRYTVKIELLNKLLNKKPHMIADNSSNKGKKKSSKKSQSPSLVQTRGYEQLMQNSLFWLNRKEVPSQFVEFMKASVGPFVSLIQKYYLKRHQETCGIATSSFGGPKTGRRFSSIVRALCFIEGARDVRWNGKSGRVQYSNITGCQTLSHSMPFVSVVFPDRSFVGALTFAQRRLYKKVLKRFVQYDAKNPSTLRFIDAENALAVNVLSLAMACVQGNRPHLYAFCEGDKMPDYLKKILGIPVDDAYVFMCPGLIVGNRLRKFNYAFDAFKMLQSSVREENVSIRDVVKNITGTMVPQGYKFGIFYVIVPRDGEGGTVGFCPHQGPLFDLSRTASSEAADKSLLEIYKKEDTLIDFHKKNMTDISFEESCQLSDYIGKRFRFQHFFVMSDVFANDTVYTDPKKYDHPYFCLLSTLTKDLRKMRENFSPKLQSIVEKFDKIAIDTLGYSGEELLRLMSLRILYKDLFFKIFGTKKQLENRLYPDGYKSFEPIVDSEIKKSKKEACAQLDIRDFFADQAALYEDAKMPPMNDLYTTACLALMKHGAVSSTSMLFAILGNALDKPGHFEFFMNKSSLYRYYNRILDMRAGRLPFISPEKYAEVEALWTKVDTMVKDLGTCLKETRKFKCAYFHRYFRFFYPQFISLHRTYFEAFLDKVRGFSYLGPVDGIKTVKSGDFQLVKFFYPLCEQRILDPKGSFYRHFHMALGLLTNGVEKDLDGSITKTEPLSKEELAAFRKKMLQPFLMHMVKSESDIMRPSKFFIWGRDMIDKIPALVPKV